MENEAHEFTASVNASKDPKWLISNYLSLRQEGRKKGKEGGKEESMGFRNLQTWD